ncbi:MAG: glycosyltransferase [Candidatus Hermodarchaeota archaeon]
MKVIAITPNQKHDLLASTVIEGLYKNNIEIIASDKGNCVKKVYSNREIIKHSKDADYIFVIWGKIKGNKPPKYYLLEKINRPEITAYIDGSEWTYTGYREANQLKEVKHNPKRMRGENWVNEKMFDYCKFYFKRECYPEDSERGIIPLLFAAMDKNFGNFNVKKKYDIFCSFGQKQTGLRSEIEDSCRKLSNEGYNVLIEFGLDYNEYLKIISSSYISIDSWGAGNCNGRFWEIIANKSCCFCQKYNILFPNAFKDGLNYVEYSDIEEFEKKIRFYLDNKDKCLEIAEEGYKHLLKYHTSKARVKYLLDNLKD